MCDVRRAYAEIVAVWPYVQSSSTLVEERSQLGRRLILALLPDQLAIIDGASFNLSYTILYSNLRFFGANEGLGCVRML